jgi:hypothetical protein
MSQDTPQKQAADLMGSGPNGEFLEPGTCDNVTSSGRCNKKAENVCKGCLIVQVSQYPCEVVSRYHVTSDYMLSKGRSTRVH